LGYWVFSPHPEHGRRVTACPFPWFSCELTVWTEFLCSKGGSPPAPPAIRIKSPFERFFPRAPRLFLGGVHLSSGPFLEILLSSLFSFLLTPDLSQTPCDSGFTRLSLPSRRGKRRHEKTNSPPRLLILRPPFRDLFFNPRVLCIPFGVGYQFICLCRSFLPPSGLIFPSHPKASSSISSLLVTQNSPPLHSRG